MEPLTIGGIRVDPGTRKDVKLRLSEQSTATPVFLPVTVVHGAEAGPRVFVTAAVHGDEINGVEMVRRIRLAVKPARLRGTLLLVPIANPISFMNQSRHLPDGRDLNRSFPGRPRGSMASAMASAIFRKVVQDCDFGIDLHTSAQGRTCFPHVRADMRVPGVRRLAFAFGTEVVVDLPGGKGVLRREATRRGISTIVYEAGERLRFQRGLIEMGVRGVCNVLSDLRMYSFRRRSSKIHLVVKERKWVRARKGGILSFHVRPGDVIDAGATIAMNTKPYGTEVRAIEAPFSGLVLGMTTVPMVHPGSAVCHLVRLGSRLGAARRLLRVPKGLFE